MLPPTRDPRGYYALLGLNQEATAEDIQRAFRQKAKEWHPDRDQTEGADTRFQKLNEAYQVLKDEKTRASYDSGGRLWQKKASDGSKTQAATACHICNKVSAQPRHVAFLEVSSRFPKTISRRIEGVFCPDCAHRTALRASIHSWYKGWWGPRGFLLTPVALWVNLMGGKKDKAKNATLLIKQAQAFLSQGKLPLACAVARQARPFAEMPAQIRQLRDFLESRHAGKALTNRWRRFGKTFGLQLLPFLVLFLFLLAAVHMTVGLSLPFGQQEPPRRLQDTPRIVPLPDDLQNTDLYYRVKAEHLDIRKGPDLYFPILGRLQKDTPVFLRALVPGTAFVKIRAPGRLEGFVFSDLLEKDSSMTLDMFLIPPQEQPDGTPDAAPDAPPPLPPVILGDGAR